MIDQAENLRELMKRREVSLPTPSEEKEGGRSQENGTRIITIASGKGGVGKTNFAVNLALAYSKLGKRVIVLDADLGLANVNVALGVIPKYNLYHVMRKQKTMKQVILSTSYGIDIVAGASGFSRIANLSDQERAAFVSELSELSAADVVIVDTSAGISPNVLAFVEAADDVLIVTTPEPTAITDAYGMIKIISTEINDLDLDMKLVINQVTSAVEAKKVAKRIVSITAQFLNLKVDYLGFVYDDPSVPAAIRKQVPFMVSSPREKASLCMHHIARRLENLDVKTGKGVAHFIKKLLRRGG